VLRPLGLFPGEVVAKVDCGNLFLELIDRFEGKGVLTVLRPGSLKGFAAMLAQAELEPV
jgi:hypothetical protein